MIPKPLKFVLVLSLLCSGATFGATLRGTAGTEWPAGMSFAASMLACHMAVRSIRVRSVPSPSA